MNASFVQLGIFVSAWKYLGLDDEDLRALENVIGQRPQAGKVIPGTGGVRKIRFAPPSWNRGKSGSVRVCYACFLSGKAIFLLTAYGKNRKDNLDAAEKKLYRKLLSQIEQGLPKEW